MVTWSMRRDIGSQRRGSGRHVWHYGYRCIACHCLDVISVKRALREDRRCGPHSVSWKCWTSGNHQRKVISPCASARHNTFSQTTPQGRGPQGRRNTLPAQGGYLPWYRWEWDEHFWVSSPIWEGGGRKYPPSQGTPAPCVSLLRE